jgi:16S rRNA (cytosine1402-N4)-methyltransferase
MEHIPVLFHQVIELLQPKVNGRYLDGTLGAGGHTAGILNASAPSGRVLAFDRDPEAITFAKQQLGTLAERVTFINDSYATMKAVVEQENLGHFDGILLDLGLSSRQLDNAERGFSFMRDGALDMRFDSTQGQTAAELLNNLSESELAEIIWRFGEEKQGRRMAQIIMKNRPLHTTKALADLIAANFPRRGRIHPATKLFQALRIAVNDELTAVAQGVLDAIDLLSPGGRLAVISFHSLEDRIVKQTFRQASQTYEDAPELPTGRRPLTPTLQLISRKPILPTDEEVAQNPRSRSAKLRVAEKI